MRANTPGQEADDRGDDRERPADVAVQRRRQDVASR